MRCWFAAALLQVQILPVAAVEDPPVITGVDHVIVAVTDLEQAARSYQALGFVLKPGRPHSNGIRNQHVKFSNGTEIELLSVDDAKDALSEIYRHHLDRHGDSPAFAGLFAPDRAALLQRLRAAGVAPQEQGLVTLRDAPELAFLFFGRRNHSPSDRPEHFRHPNGAITLAGVWLAPEDIDSVAGLLQALGARNAGTVENGMGQGWKARLLAMNDGFVALVDSRHRPHAELSVVGVTLAVKDLTLARKNLPEASKPGHRMVIRPDMTHGLWLELLEQAAAER